MFRTTKLYPCMAVVLAVICVIFLSNCGGGGNSSVVPNTNPTTDNPVSYTNTPTPVLIQKPIQGYIYAGNITTEDGETVPCINVLDVPAFQTDSSGNQPFVTQVANSLKEDYPEDWAKPTTQELYAQLSKTLSESKPLSEINGQVYSVYADSQSATPIPVSSDGYFDNTVLTGAADSNVKLEVTLGEDNYTDVETLPSSDNINSSDATTAVLKSCPEKIFAFPGEIVIFKIQAEPGINLKSAGLKFTLENPSIGCLTQPVYLCIFGKNKYQMAYGCLYVKKGLNTPLASNIIATTNTGLSLKIFTEIIKSTASISGTVYTGGMPLVKGFVYSLGPKACCKLDSNGAYTLPKVFRGHERSVIATWWTEENGQKIRHREEKIIDFFEHDITGFNFGVPPTPTPTATPTATPTMSSPSDPYYDKGVSKVLGQYQEWEKELGSEQAVQKTIDWINKKIASPNAPEEIKEAIKVSDDDYEFWILFVDGRSVKIRVKPFDNIMFDISEISSQSSCNYIENQNDKLLLPRQSLLSSSNKLYSSNVITPSSSKVLILSMNTYENQIKWTSPPTYAFSHTVYGELANDLIKNGYEVTRKIITLNDIQVRNPILDPNSGDLIRLADLNNPSFNISPYDLSNLGEYGVIYIATHGIHPHRLSTGTYEPGALSCGVICENDPNTNKWMNDNKDTQYSPCPWNYIGYNKWYTNYVGTWENGQLIWMKHLMLTTYFFQSQKFDNSIIFLPICYSAANTLSDPTFADYPINDFLCTAFENRCLVYIGCDDKAADVWSQLVPYYYFYYMMYGFKKPNLPSATTYDLSIPKTSPDGYQWPVIGQEATPNPNSPPLSAREAYKALEGLIIDQNIYNLNSTTLDTHMTGCMMNIHIKNDNTYFPIPIEVTIEKNITKGNF